MGRIIARPETIEPPPRYTNILRHFAIVIDGSQGTVSVYSDGALINNPTNVSRKAICAAYDSDYHAAVLAQNRTNVKSKQKAEVKAEAGPMLTVKTIAVTLLGAQDISRPPESSVSPDKPMELQQLRIYYENALDAAQIKEIHDTSEFNGVALKQCSVVGESGEKDVLGWKDVLGHDCAWYREQRLAFPFICAGSEVSEKCKVACAKQQCYSPKKAEEYSLGGQIQMFTEPSTLCVSSNASDERGLPVMNSSLLQANACGTAFRTAEGGQALLRMSGALETFYPPAKAPTVTTWAIAPKGGNVTLVILALDVHDSVVKVRTDLGFPRQPCIASS